MDKDARKGAAEKEPAWAGCGAAPGLEIWRIEKFKVMHRVYHGILYRGICSMECTVECTVKLPGLEIWRVETTFNGVVWAAP